MALMTPVPVDYFLLHQPILKRDIINGTRHLTTKFNTVHLWGRKKKRLLSGSLVKQRTAHTFPGQAGHCAPPNLTKININGPASYCFFIYFMPDPCTHYLSEKLVAVPACCPYPLFKYCTYVPRTKHYTVLEYS